jgi:hypothetical protein
VSEAPPSAKTPEKANRGLPGGLTGNALITAVIAAVVSGVISFGIAHYQAADAAGQAHAAQVADGASQVESAAANYYQAAESLYAARRQCARQEHPGSNVPPGCPPGVTAFLTAEAELGAAFANTSDRQVHSLLAAFSLATHDALAQAAAPQTPFLPGKLTDDYYALIARCGQLIQGH